MRIARLVWILAAFVLAPALVQATPIIIFNTGVDDFGSLLPDGAIDPHYTLVSSPDPGFPGPNAFVAQQGGWVWGYWVPDSATSKWISPATNPSATQYPLTGNYVYQTTFDLTGLDPSTAQISGIWTTDNAGVDIILNGTSLGYTTPDAAFAHFDGTHYAFTILSGFVDGENILQFVVHNDGTPRSPTGLRVELSGSADPEVPEPATLALAGLGLLAGAALLRRRSFGKH